MTRGLLVLAGALSVALGTVTGAGTAQRVPAPTSVPTFTKDIAPILYESCAQCHRPGDIAPMSLLTYEDARPWSRAIKQKVMAREMPPWYADARYGTFRNDRSLTAQQVNTIVAWVDAGSPKGDDANLPSVPKFASGWSNGEPDYIIEMPVEFNLPAEGQIDYQYFYQPVPFDHDVFAEALEMRPSNPGVVHHMSTHIVDLPEGTKIINGKAIGSNGKELGPNEIRKAGTSVFDPGASSKLISFVPGRGFERHRPGAAKRIPAGKYIQWNIHYQASGRPEQDRSRLGLWVNKEPVTHEVYSRIIGQALPTDPVQEPRYIAEGREVPIEVKQADGNQTKRAKMPNIPPYADNWAITSITPITETVTLYAISPHMHLRGKDMKIVIVYPDGRQETVLSVPKYDFNWQLQYELETPLKIPAGSKMMALGHYDNSLKNRWNPAPEKEVFWSEQSWDEMYEGWVEFSIDSQDLTTKKTTTQQP